MENFLSALSFALNLIFLMYFIWPISSTTFVNFIFTKFCFHICKKVHHSSIQYFKMKIRRHYRPWAPQSCGVRNGATMSLECFNCQFIPGFMWNLELKFKTPPADVGSRHEKIRVTSDPFRNMDSKSNFFLLTYFHDNVTTWKRLYLSVVCCCRVLFLSSFTVVVDLSKSTNCLHFHALIYSKYDVM